MYISLTASFDLKETFAPFGTIVLSMYGCEFLTTL